jgi:hypothetical protein
LELDDPDQYVSSIPSQPRDLPSALNSILLTSSSLDSLTWYSTAVGAAYGTAKSGIGITGLATFKPQLVMKVRKFTLHLRLELTIALQSLIPVVMSGIIAVYGLVVSVVISGSCTSVPPSLISHTNPYLLASSVPHTIGLDCPAH